MALKRLSPFRCPQFDGPVLTPGQRSQPVVTTGPSQGKSVRHAIVTSRTVQHTSDFLLSC